MLSNEHAVRTHRSMFNIVSATGLMAALTLSLWAQSAAADASEGKPVMTSSCRVPAL